MVLDLSCLLQRDHVGLLERCEVGLRERTHVGLEVRLLERTQFGLVFPRNVPSHRVVAREGA